MTSEFVTKGMLNSDSENAVEDASIADKKVFNDSKSSSPIKKPVDIDDKRVLDENFRLNVEKTLSGIASLPDNWNDLTVREQRNWVYLKIKDHYTNMPDSLVFVCVGLTVHGDCGQASDVVPEWLDREKFLRGQRFATDHYAGIILGQLLALYMLFSFDYGLKPLIITGKSGDPFTAFKRYISTEKRVKNWYSSDVWTEGTDGHRDMQMVRRMHVNIRNKLMDSSHLEIDEAATIQNPWCIIGPKVREDFRETCPAAAPGQCLHTFSKDEQFKRPKVLNQCEMAMTQFGFLGLVILYPEILGIHGASNEDLDAFCHVWRGLGYLLGIEDEFNFCKGTLEEVQQRSRDTIEYWVKPNLRDVTPEWEHMMRCVIEGANYYFPVFNFEMCLLFITDMIGVPMPRVVASISYSTWIRLKLMQFTGKWIARLPGVPALMTKIYEVCAHRAQNYTDEKLMELRKRSDITLAKGIAETIAINNGSTIARPNAWLKAPLFIFTSVHLLLNLPIVVKEYAKKLMDIVAGSVLPC